MRDAVAEILAGREALSRPPATAVLISAVAHLLLITAAVVIADKIKQEPPARPVIIRLAGTVAPVAMKAATPSPATSKPTQKEVTPPPLPTPEPPKKAVKKTSEGESLFGRSDFQPPKQSQAVTPPKTIPPPPPAAASASGNLGGSPAVGKTGVTSLEGGPFPYNAYIDRMVSLVGTHWFRPTAGDQVETRLFFIIDRSGLIRDVRVEQSSGDASFDRAAQRAILETSPLPPLPLAYSGTYLGVHLTFH